MVSLLEKVFLELELVKCKTDPCFFMKADIYLVVHVDDCGIAYKSEEILESFITNLTNKGLLLTKEGALNEYLGINYERHEDKIELTQKGLITKIITSVGLSKCSPNWVPTYNECLGVDPDGKSMTDTWSYPLIIGMLLYLSPNTRPAPLLLVNAPVFAITPSKAMSLP